MEGKADLQTNMKECVALLSFSFEFFCFFFNVMAILALGLFPGSCANAIARHVKKRGIFLGLEWFCVRCPPAFALQLLTE